MSKLEFLLGQLASKLWIRPALMSGVMVGWIWVAYMTGNRLDFEMPVAISRETLLNLFTILASTMLTVATFSVSAISSAYASVASSATPRATRIVMQDGGVQSTLGAFLATFIYAVVGITALSAVTFSAAGRLMLFFAFVFLVGWVLVSFLQWVDRVSRLGRLGDTIRRVTEVGRTAFGPPELAGAFGGRCAVGDPPEKGVRVRDTRFGYVQHVNMSALQKLAEELEGEIWLEGRTGALVTAGLPIAVVVTDVPQKEWEDGIEERLREAITIGPERHVETDPRYAMILLAEISGRALSPAVNDPGTAIAVMSKMLELFHLWVEGNRETEKTGEDCEFDRVWMKSVTAQDLVWDAFTPIARDGAGQVEVGLRLQKALLSLAHMGNEDLRAAVQAYSKEAAELADVALVLESQKQAVDEISRRVMEVA